MLEKKEPQQKKKEHRHLVSLLAYVIVVFTILGISVATILIRSKG